MKISTKIILLLAFILMVSWSLAGCSSADTPPDMPDPVENGDPDPDENGTPDPDENGTPDPSDETPMWASTIDEIIMIEGTEETITLNLMQTERFVTYVPEDMIFNNTTDDSWFFAAFGDEPVEDAYLRITFLPDLTDPPTLEEIGVALNLDDYDLNAYAPQDHRRDWSKLEFYCHSHSSYSISGWLGEHQGEYFVVLMHYPWEYGDGFEPRVARILEHLYWNDTQEYLEQ